MRIGNKVWSGAPNTVAIDAPLQTKAVTIVNDGFIPRDVITLAEALSGRQAEGLDANVVMAPVAWIMRTFPDAIARVKRRAADDAWEWVERHPVQRLIKRPNPWYNGDTLWQGTALSFTLNGNAYWEKVRNRFGQVIQLWYRPHWLLKPHTPLDGSTFIDSYEYDTGRGIRRLEVRDVVHFKFGLDPRDPRYGYSPLRSLLREVLTDQEAARFSMRILENMGIPGVVVSPTVAPTGDAFAPTREETEALKTYLQTEFTGNGRGTTLVFGQPTQITQFGFDPSKLTLGELRDQAEERVCAMLGIPASVVGFGSGMDQTKVGATMKEHVKLAWKQCLFPMQRQLAEQLDTQLLADFVPDYEDQERVEFDVSDALSLKEDATELSARVCSEVEAGILRVDKAQSLLGYDVDDTQQGYLRKLTVMFTPAETVPEPMAPPGADTGDPNAPPPAGPGTKRFDTTIIGPNDPAAQRAVLEMLKAAQDRNGNNGHHTEGVDVAA